LAIEVREAFDVHHKVKDLKTSQDKFLNILLAVCGNLRVHWMHRFEKIND